MILWAEVAHWAAPSSSRPQAPTDNGVSKGRSNWLAVTPHPLHGNIPWAPPAWCKREKTNHECSRRGANLVPMKGGAHRRSVAVLWMPYKTRCNPMHPLYDVLPVLYMPVRVTRDALVAYRYNARFSSPQNLAVAQDIYSPIIVPLEWTCWPCMRWFGAGWFQEQV